MAIDTEHFRIELLKERERVQAALANLRDSHPGSIDDEVEEVTGMTDNYDHLAETATGTLDREIDYTLGENSGQVLAEIDRALQRIEDGTYGKCAECGKEIPVERLEVYPWASLCIDDARKAERG
jgi:DnaK suppressor protein